MEKNKPQGGTELQLAYLHKYVDKELLDKVQITTSIPGKIPLSKDKPNILWQKNSWDQPNIHPQFDTIQYKPAAIDSNSDIQNVSSQILGYTNIL